MSATKFYRLKTSSVKVVARSTIAYLSNGINILAWDDPVTDKLGPKGTNPNSKDARFTFHTRSAVQLVTADLDSLLPQTLCTAVFSVDVHYSSSCFMYSCLLYLRCHVVFRFYVTLKTSK